MEEVIKLSIDYESILAFLERDLADLQEQKRVVIEKQKCLISIIAGTRMLLGIEVERYPQKRDLLDRARDLADLIQVDDFGSATVDEEPTQEIEHTITKTITSFPSERPAINLPSKANGLRLRTKVEAKLPRFFELLSSGVSIPVAAVEAGINKRTAYKVCDSGLAGDLSKILCKCGLSVTHRGLCRARREQLGLSVSSRRLVEHPVQFDKEADSPISLKEQSRTILQPNRKQPAPVSIKPDPLKEAEARGREASQRLKEFKQRVRQQARTAACGVCLIRTIDGKEMFAAQPDCPKHYGLGHAEKGKDRKPDGLIRG